MVILLGLFDSKISQSRVGHFYGYHCRVIRFYNLSFYRKVGRFYGFPSRVIRFYDFSFYSRVGLFYGFPSTVQYGYSIL